MEWKTFKDKILITLDDHDLYPDTSEEAKKAFDEIASKLVRSVMSGVTVDLSSFYKNDKA